ncbi:hypothetical protein OG689_05795 [Kitasatospora sp. NBC_00240]|uniref:hypothetical protein n=1 Tax=Kitasatospora sp. NBC_00240 TaxID=2903567 RepID=UPI0022512FA4|nr:hypothetical protein [Kitasatospora sp. NBC_00240]MCX5208808.1 hypothetical protein [Kitasatospora sp. NBC_00240]
MRSTLAKAAAVAAVAGLALFGTATAASAHHNPPRNAVQADEAEWPAGALAVGGDASAEDGWALAVGGNAAATGGIALAVGGDAGSFEDDEA